MMINWLQHVFIVSVSDFQVSWFLNCWRLISKIKIGDIFLKNYHCGIAGSIRVRLMIFRQRGSGVTCDDGWRCPITTIEFWLAIREREGTMGSKFFWSLIQYLNSYTLGYPKAGKLWGPKYHRKHVELNNLLSIFLVFLSFGLFYYT